MSRLAIFIWLFLLVGPVASAQPGLPPGAGGGTGANAPVPVDISIPQKVTLSGPEMIERGREYRSSMSRVEAELNKMVEDARRKKDVIRLNCLMDKAVQVKGNLQIADTALQKLQEANARQDQAGALHQFTIVVIVNQKVQTLRYEGETCVGAELNYIGATRVEVEAPDVAEGMTEPSLEPPPLERPLAASNYTQ